MGKSVAIYSERREGAVAAIRHEVLHHDVAECSRPYVELLNRLLAEVNKEVYRRTEQLVEKLVDLIHD